jgi:hypothetical protein
MNTNLEPLVTSASQGRLNSEDTATLLGFRSHDIPILTRAGLLKPLGRPADSAPKYFARVQVLVLAADAKWLAKASEALTENWRKKNARRGSRTEVTGQRNERKAC